MFYCDDGERARTCAVPKRTEPMSHVLNYWYLESSQSQQSPLQPLHRRRPDRLCRRAAGGAHHVRPGAGEERADAEDGRGVPGGTGGAAGEGGVREHDCAPISGLPEMGHLSDRKSGEMPVTDPRDSFRGELAADLDADPGHSYFDSRTPVALLVSQVAPVFSLFTSFASARAAVCFDASLLTNRAGAF